MISIITPSVRFEGLEIVRKAILQQSFKDWEWIIGSSFDPEIKEAIWVKDDFKGGIWTLNRIYNKLIKQSKGELLVSWQDCIYANPDALTKFWNSYELVGKKGLIASSGHQYERMGKYRPEIQIWTDPRRRFDQGSFYEIYPNDLEWNLAGIPQKAMFDVGGFDEELDQRGFGMDGYQVNERLDLLGWKFFMNHDIESFTIRHDRSAHGGQINWDKHNNLTNGEYEKRRNELKREGKWPRLDFLVEK